MRGLKRIPYTTNLKLVTHYIKKYPDRLKLIIFKTPYSNFVSKIAAKNIGAPWLKTEDEKLDGIEKSIGQTKTKIADLTICNAFDMFVTFTLNCRACIPKCINKPCTCDKLTCKRYDLDYVIRTQKTWYNNQIKQHGRFPYIQVMELHKDKGYHFHALFKNYPGKLKFWKNDKKDGRPIYNLASNRKGWTTVKEIYDISGTSSYIRKYIMKDMPLFPGKKRFWSSQGLKRPIVVQNNELMQEILSKPNQETWIPEEKPTIRENGTLKQNSTNLSSITTVMLDNEKSYFEELELIKRIDTHTKNLPTEITTGEIHLSNDGDCITYNLLPREHVVSRPLDKPKDT